VAYAPSAKGFAKRVDERRNPLPGRRARAVR
jgi:hypothetical protein